MELNKYTKKGEIMKDKKVQVSILPLDDHRCVMVHEDEGGVILTFSSRISRNDIINGLLQPKARAYRYRKQILTQVPLLKSTASALKRILNGLPEI